jgi:hypothetical protein
LNVVRRSVIDSAISVFTVFMAPSMTKKINTALEKGKTTCPCQKIFSFSFSVHCFHTNCFHALFPCIVSIHCFHTLFPYIVSIHCFHTLFPYIVSIHCFSIRCFHAYMFPLFVPLHCGYGPVKLLTFFSPVLVSNV